MSRNSESHPLSRTHALRSLVPAPERQLIVAGLGTACFDAARLTDDGPNLMAVDGVMGIACSVGLGLALARPDQSVLVLTGEGELLMGLGALATAAAQAPPNLSILCVDNAVYGLTGQQRTHTAARADMLELARAAGVSSCARVRHLEEIAEGRRVLEDESQLSFVVLEVAAEPPEPFPFDRDGARIRHRFRAHVAAQGDRT